MIERQVKLLAEDYIAIIQQDYLEKLYFYALKKTGNKHEAEDLAQDIATQAIMSLVNGSTPEQFAYWFWTIARNRYARWAAQKNRHSRVITGEDKKLAVIPDHSPSIEESLIFKENVALLKRELSLLSSNYREITVSYYMKGEKIPEIADRLQLPVGTVKRKLYESRKNLKEGMNMARETGQRSFSADNISFTKSGGDGRDGSPWSLLQRLIPKNILLAAYRNPLTLEELCMEMGVSMPYMEEEVKLLTEGTLLKEVGNGRYETDFIIVDKTMQMDIFYKLVELNDRFSPIVIELLDTILEKLQNNDFIRNQSKTEELYWTLIPLLVDIVADHVHVTNHIPSAYTKRPQQGNWDITGYEECSLPFSLRMSHDGIGNGKTILWTYKISMENLWERAGVLSSHEVGVIAASIRSGKTIDALSDIEKEVIRNLKNRGFIQEKDQSITPTFLVLYRDQMDQWKHSLSHENPFEELYKQLCSLMEEYYAYAHHTIGQNIPHRLNDQLRFVSGQYLYNFRMVALRYALEHGRLAIPANIDKSTIAMYMILNNM